MLGFFRKIRRQLASENNVAKYLRYAVGEVFLVVVGILIALQINTWNEERKTSALTEKYMQNIKNDMVADTNNINNILEGGSHLKKLIADYYDFFENKEWTIEEIIDSCSKIGFNHFRYFPTNPSFNDMHSAGKSNLLEDDIRLNLTQLKIEQDFLVIITDRMITDNKNNQYEVEKFWDMDKHPSDFFLETKFVPNRKDLIQGLKHYHNILKNINVVIGLIELRGNEIKARSKNIIKQIDKELY